MKSTLHSLALALALVLSSAACSLPESPDLDAAPPAEDVEAAAQDLPRIDAKVAGLERRAGLLDLYVDGDAARAWLKLPAPDRGGVHAECLYMEGLTTGLGSNPVGLDRGQVRGPWLVRFTRVGRRVFLERPNLAFRADSDDPSEVAATRESFATSVLWAADVEAEDPDGAVLVDLTPFVVRDAHGVTRALAGAGQGSWTLDSGRSALDPQGCLAFPDNLELEARLTFAGDGPGAHVRETAPDSRAITLVQHHSLIRLPDAGYEPRRHDPRSGSFSVDYLDYAAGLDESLDVRLAVRHRLEKLDPGAPRSRVEEPIVYHVDRGAPEPVRSALLEGASWWKAAFESAGFVDAFRVELLPEGAHPLDVRYNVIQWVHRSTRGWSYGNAVADPRTGEILKGHVSLGSLRVRQDRLLFEGLAGTRSTGTGRPDDPIELALARIRQLAAHEVGHTLGFAHNFTASAFGDRASVMDYPAPLVTPRAEGGLDFSRAYGVGVGDWDVVAVEWLYGVPPPGADERAYLDGVLERAASAGMRYHSDEDARPAGAAQPYASLWDNFADPATGLENAVAVRRDALARFGPGNLPAREPRARLEEVLTPVYFHHRYQLEAAVKMVGGVDYDHALQGDGRPDADPVPAPDQRRALAVVLATLDPAFLDLPEPLLRALAPRPPGQGRSREQPATSTAPVFDALGVAATAAGMTVDGLLQPERCARVVDQHRRDPGLPSLEEVLEALTDAAFGTPEVDARRAEIQRVVQSVVVRGLIDLAQHPSAPPHVRARAEGRLRRLIDEDWAVRELSEDDFAHRRMLVDELLRFRDRRSSPASPLPPAAEPPPGSPIGAPPAWGLAGCSRDVF